MPPSESVMGGKPVMYTSRILILINLLPASTFQTDPIYNTSSAIMFAYTLHMGSHWVIFVPTLVCV